MVPYTASLCSCRARLENPYVDEKARGVVHLEYHLAVFVHTIAKLLERGSFVFAFFAFFAFFAWRPQYQSKMMLGGASQIVSRIRTKCNGKKLTSAGMPRSAARAAPPPFHSPVRPHSVGVPCRYVVLEDVRNERFADAIT